MPSKSNFSFITVLAGFVLILGTSCSKKGTVLPPDTATDSSNTGPTGVGATTLFDSVSVIVWVEAAANFERLGSADKMAVVFQKLAAMGANGIVLDVKGIPGLVSYNSSIAQPLRTWNGFTQAPDFDYLKNGIEQAKKAGLKVYVSMSVFAEGMNYYGQRIGKVFTDPAFSAINSQVMTASGDIHPITDVYTYGMLNPLQPLAQSYELSLIKEVVAGYNIDGFVLDYCRYYDITADFSDFTLDKFKQWANLTSVKPTDIVSSWTTSNGALTPLVTGPLFKSWLEFRALTIHDFFSGARAAIKAIKPALPVCAYAGSWYDTYYTVGVNWASNKYDPSANGYNWATGTYKNTGYAELLDMFMTGNYTPTLTGPGWWTVQGEISGTKSVLQSANVYYGGVDIGNTQWANLQNMNDAITMIMKQTKGVMLFDLVYIDDPSYNQFNVQLYDDLRSVINAAK